MEQVILEKEERWLSVTQLRERWPSAHWWPKLNSLIGSQTGFISHLQERDNLAHSLIISKPYNTA